MVIMTVYNGNRLAVVEKNPNISKLLDALERGGEKLEDGAIALKRQI